MGACRNCLLPGEVPEAGLDAHGVCALCRQHNGNARDRAEALREKRIADLEEALRDCRGRGAYDCIVNLSGGKDSCYLLYKLVRERGLKVLAFTANVNIPEVAWRNIRRTVALLNVEHIVYTPPQDFYTKMFRFLLRNQEARGAVRTVCYICAPLYEGYSLRLALEKRVPLVLAGYSPGQPDPERMQYEYSRELICERDWTPPELRASGLFDESELDLFWDPSRCPAGTAFPRYLAPFHAWPYDQNEVMSSVVKLGLVPNRRHANPIHSNCPVNWLLMYSDLKNLGYNPYAPEFARLIREGKASRRYWSVAQPLVNFMIRHKVLLGRNVTRSLKALDLREEDLRITRPAPASPRVSAFSGGRLEPSLCSSRASNLAEG